MTGDDLIRAVKRMASVPTSQATFTNPDFLELANTEIETYLVPFFNALKEEYFLHDMDYAYVAGDRYRIPRRAVGGKLRDVKYVSSGNEHSIPRIPLDDVDDYARFGFYVRGQHIHLTEFAVAPTLIRLIYQVMPGRLTLAANAAIVASKTASSITLTSTPAAFISPLTFDIIHKGEPFEHYDSGLDRVGNLAANVISLTDGLGTTEVEVGDYVTLAGESPVVQFPSAIAHLLVQRVAMKTLEAMGDTEAVGTAASVLQQTEIAVATLFRNRIEGEPPVIIPDSPLFRS